jgi:hypothetical protein
MPRQERTGAPVERRRFESAFRGRREDCVHLFALAPREAVSLDCGLEKRAEHREVVDLIGNVDLRALTTANAQISHLESRNPYEGLEVQRLDI